MVDIIAWAGRPRSHATTFPLGSAVAPRHPARRRAQDPPPVVPAKHTEVAGKMRDLGKLTPQQRLWYLAARQGMDWLRRTNKQDGKFVYGFLPDLRVPLDGDSYTAQAGAAFALARAARFLGDEPSLAISRQALLTLLVETTVDARDREIRHTAAPPQLVNRLASHGQLVLAIHELPGAGQDLLEQADQLCNYLKHQQLPNGALWVTEGGADPKLAAEESALECAGLALQAIVRSQQVRPAPWKLDVAQGPRVRPGDLAADENRRPGRQPHARAGRRLPVDP